VPGIDERFHKYLESSQSTGDCVLRVCIWPTASDFAAQANVTLWGNYRSDRRALEMSKMTLGCAKLEKTEKRRE